MAGFGIDSERDCENLKMLRGRLIVFITFTWRVAIGSGSYKLLLTFERFVIYRH